MESLGNCHYCGQGIPKYNIDGVECVEGVEYKEVYGEPEIKWHYKHPLYPDCYMIDVEDPGSPWFKRYDDMDEDVLISRFAGRHYNVLEDYEY